MSDQLPPPDELYAVRDRIKQLQERERELRSLMTSDPAARTGNEYCVELKDVAMARVDLEELRAAYPAEVEEHTHTITQRRIELRRITKDGEVIRIKRKEGRNAQ